jgi:hypothetical protein
LRETTGIGTRIAVTSRPNEPFTPTLREMPEAITAARLGGYMHARYAAAFAEWGRPHLLARSGGWALVRGVPGAKRHDAMGCYPVLSCDDWSGLRADLEDLADTAIAFTAVIDPFAAIGVDALERAFPHVLRPFKRHFVVDLAAGAPGVHAAHRRNIQRAARSVDVDIVDGPTTLLPIWLELYDVLVRRHGITGLHAFSPTSFAAQLAVPGMVAVRAVAGGETVGITLWMDHGEDIYYHLGAQSEAGYAMASSFAMFDAAIAHFRAAGRRRIDLGGGAGLRESSDGLTRFKAGWTDTTMPALLGGRVLDAVAYAQLGNEARDTSFFPAYRAGQFL